MHGEAAPSTASPGQGLPTPRHPGTHPPPAARPGSAGEAAPPRPLQSGRGGAVSDGSRCHLHLAALGTGRRLQLHAPPPGEPTWGWWQRVGAASDSCRPVRVCGVGKSQSSAGHIWGWGTQQAPTPRGSRNPLPRVRADRAFALPGTTPLVAIALMEMAVSIVCRRKHSVSTGHSSLLARAAGGEAEQESRAPEQAVGRDGGGFAGRAAGCNRACRSPGSGHCCHIPPTLQVQSGS